MTVIKLETSGPNIIKGLHSALEVFAEQVEEYCEYDEQDNAPLDMVESLNGIVSNLAKHIELDFTGFESTHGEISAGGVMGKTNQLTALLEGAYGFESE